MTHHYRQIGPLLFSVAAPEGWGLEGDDDPMASAFLGHRGVAALNLPITLKVGVQPATRDWQIHLATAGWLLETAGPEGSGHLRWSLPDPSGGFLWRATWRENDILVEAGSRLVDPIRQVLRTPLRYPLDQILAIHSLAAHRGCVVHAAGWALGGKAIVAAGVSGAGKTTLSRLLRAADPELVGLSDDRVLVHQERLRGWQTWGTPWAGEGKIASPGRAELQALLVLQHADHEKLTHLDPRQAFERLLPALSVPWYDPARSELVLSLLEQLVQKIPTYQLACRPRPEAAHLALSLLR